MSFTICEFKDKCTCKVTDDSFWDLCMGQKLSIDEKTPWREKVCAWYNEYKNPPGSKKSPSERFKEVLP